MIVRMRKRRMTRKMYPHHPLLGLRYPLPIQ
jgi:hypothetical protein